MRGGTADRREAAGLTPWVTLLLVAAAAAVFVIPGAAGALRFDRAAVASGQAWRLVTGHFAHVNFEHFAWDAGTLLFLGILCERDGRRRFVGALAGAAAAIALAVWATPGLHQYSGLSGLDSAVFALLSVTILREKAAERSWGWAAAAAGVLVLFVGKCGYEAATGTTIFAQDLEGSVPVPLAHAAGAAIGALAGVAGWGFRMLSSGFGVQSSGFGWGYGLRVVGRVAGSTPNQPQPKTTPNPQPQPNPEL